MDTTGGSEDTNAWSARFSRISANSTRASAECRSAISARFCKSAMLAFCCCIADISSRCSCWSSERSWFSSRAPAGVGTAGGRPAPAGAGRRARDPKAAPMIRGRRLRLVAARRRRVSRLRHVHQLPLPALFSRRLERLLLRAHALLRLGALDRLLALERLAERLLLDSPRCAVRRLLDARRASPPPLPRAFLRSGARAARSAAARRARDISCLKLRGCLSSYTCAREDAAAREHRPRRALGAELRRGVGVRRARREAAVAARARASPGTICVGYESQASRGTTAPWYAIDGSPYERDALSALSVVVVAGTRTRRVRRGRRVRHGRAPPPSRGRRAPGVVTHRRASVPGVQLLLREFLRGFPAGLLRDLKLQVALVRLLLAHLLGARAGGDAVREVPARELSTYPRSLGARASRELAAEPACSWVRGGGGGTGVVLRCLVMIGVNVVGVVGVVVVRPHASVVRWVVRPRRVGRVRVRVRVAHRVSGVRRIRRGARRRACRG